MPREWSNSIRDPWNKPIHQMLKSIDNHNEQYFKDGNEWHLEKAQVLRNYISELKDWIQEQEKINIID